MNHWNMKKYQLKYIKTDAIEIGINYSHNSFEK